MRHYPLIQSVQGVHDLANIVVFDSNPLAYETDQIFCYCNKRDDGSEMIMCETCEMYYHSYCIGKTGAELDGIDYVCGYCAGVEDEDGNQLWQGELKPRPGKKRIPKPKPRDLVAMQARLERYERGEKEWVGPRTWGDVVEKVRAHAIKLRGKEERKYAVAKAKQAEGGHHLYDTVAGNAVVGAPLGPELIDFLDGIGELDD